MDGLDRKGFKRAIPVVSRGSFIRMIYALRKRFNTLAVILPFFFLLNSRPPVLFSPPRRMTLIWLHYNIISTRPRAGSFQYGMCAKPTPAWMSLFFLIILSSHRLSIHNSVWNEIFVPPSPLPASERTSEIRNSDTTNDWKRRNAMRRAKRFLLFFWRGICHQNALATWLDYTRADDRYRSFVSLLAVVGHRYSRAAIITIRYRLW